MIHFRKREITRMTAAHCTLKSVPWKDTAHSGAINGPVSKTQAKGTVMLSVAASGHKCVRRIVKNQKCNISLKRKRTVRKSVVRNVFVKVHWFPWAVSRFGQRAAIKSIFTCDSIYGILEL